MSENLALQFRQAIAHERPLQIVGAINAYSAMQAKSEGFRVLYLSGAGIANANLGLPDLGLINLHDVEEQANAIIHATQLPLLCDVDTGFGGFQAIQTTVKTLEAIDVAAIHIEDQVEQKRCGQRQNKTLVDTKEMCDRLRAASEARTNSDFVIMARTDALSVEGLKSAVARSLAYVEQGADMIFAEAPASIEELTQFCQEVQVPVLANMTEFGRTPLTNMQILRNTGAAMVLYPLSAFRSMAKAAQTTYRNIRQQGDQIDCLAGMQTREELYQQLDYLSAEQQQDLLIQSSKKDQS